jgi:sigma-70-like protein
VNFVIIDRKRSSAQQGTGEKVLRFDRRVTGETVEVLEETVSYTPPVPEELTDRDVRSALDGIPPEFRAVVLLADVEEFSYKEIAGILRVPMGTVMSRLSRGRALLRAALCDLAHCYGLKKAYRCSACLRRAPQGANGSADKMRGPGSYRQRGSTAGGGLHSSIWPYSRTGCWSVVAS